MVLVLMIRVLRLSLQTTYENFRYRYDNRANPYNKGVVENFKEIFCSPIPPSKNNFRAKVPKELPPSARPVGAGFVSPSMGKGADDIEMGRKATWGGEFGPGLDSGEGQMSDSEILNIKDGRLGEGSADVRTHVDELGDRAGQPTRHSSRRRQSGNWEMSPEVLALSARLGEQSRVVGSSNTGLPGGN